MIQPHCRTAFGIYLRSGLHRGAVDHIGDVGTQIVQLLHADNALEDIEPFLVIRIEYVGVKFATFIQPQRTTITGCRRAFFALSNIGSHRGCMFQRACSLIGRRNN